MSTETASLDLQQVQAQINTLQGLQDDLSSQRDAIMLQLTGEGLSVRAIGDLIGLSGPRVATIIRRARGDIEQMPAVVSDRSWSEKVAGAISRPRTTNAGATKATGVDLTRSIESMRATMQENAELKASMAKVMVVIRKIGVAQANLAELQDEIAPPRDPMKFFGG